MTEERKQVDLSVERLKNLQVDPYILQTVHADRMGKRLSDAEIKRKIELAKEMAFDLVKHYRETLGLRSVDALVDYLDLSVVYRSEKIEDYFAIIGFFESPNRIVVNDLYRENDAFWLEHQKPEWAFDQWSAVIVAHEAFHAIQEKEGLDLSEFEIELWQFAGFKKHSPVNVLIEVLANYFAQAFTGFAYYPALLDNIALMPIYPEAIHSQVEALAQGQELT